MDSLTFTINLKDLDACDGDFDQVVSDIQAFLNILHHTSPDYCLAGGILQKQLDEQVKKHKEETDPCEKFREKLDEMCPYKLEATDLAHLYADLKSEIGEAMGPVSYAAYALATKLDEANLSCKWVWDFVKYYEEHWEF